MSGVANILASSAIFGFLAWSLFVPTTKAQVGGTLESGPAATAVQDTATQPSTDFGQSSGTPFHASTANSDSLANVLLSPAQADSVKLGVERGRNLFTGLTRFEHRGPSCISCHNVGSDDVMAGGLLAKDLTHAHKRLGAAGIEAMLQNPGFPAMASAYANKSLTMEEIRDLTTFFQYVEQTSPAGDPDPQNESFLAVGTIGFVIWLAIIFIVYSNRKKGSVKDAIFRRQVGPIN